MTNNNARCTDFMKRLIFHIPHQSVSSWRTRCAAGTRHSASLRSLELTRSISSGVGGLGRLFFRADATSVDATKRDPRLPPWVGGGRWRLRRGVYGGLRMDRRRVGDFIRWRRLFLRASTSSLDLFAGGRESCWLRCSERRLQSGSQRCCLAGAMTIQRCGVMAALGVAERAFDLDGVAGAIGGVRFRGGGLHRRRLPSGTIFGGDGDDSGLDGRRRVIGDGERRPGAEHIVCADRKDGNGFNMSARALCNASATVERYVVRERRGDAAAMIPSTV